MVEAGGLSLPGALTVPAGARAVVAFAHGSGSSRLSPRNVAVAAQMHGRSLATLLFDLLTPDEAGDRGNVFDIPLLGGRPDLAGGRLARVRAATLLIVRGNDPVVLELNREAERALRCESSLVVVPGATHLFEERGALEEVARLAGEWFAGHLPS